ncbi:MAG: hypothetical protein LUD01_03270 [Clostridiales bacterium]|nr:hypothetical protein [Clostridiales bacterium]
MIFLLTEFSLDDLGIMTIFDFIILIYGAYSVYTAQQMKKTGTPPAWLVPQQDLHRIHKPQEFCDLMRPKTFLFGLVCILYGIYGLVESFYIKNDFAEAAGVTVFVVFMVWFIISLQNAKGKYMK